MVCTKGDKPTITYKFGTGNDRIYQAQYAPIDIVTGTLPIDATANYKNAGYQINFQSPQGQFGYISAIVVDYQIIYYPGGNQFDPLRGYYIAFIGCGSTSFAVNSPSKGMPTDYGGLVLSASMTTGVIDSINTNIKCASPNSNRCTFQVFSNNLLLFQDQGNCPCTYTIQCGRCPEGTCECASPIYPGYCCNDCESSAASIRSITNDLRRLNNG
ncbi:MULTISPECIES: hypothetical protein [unclassified Nostoc]|uniref:hypothetical protein n=1 Tax=unclassified Nostoc TaxID=2593658 RepID=UPI002AD3F734|nr:hypothetical protein [Nostoc sp. DedQUE03]MDZ7974028.1 hypothetical protein [Nostoc sp. DedQUE03]MDZ8048529.1 hypothetical protein [Nostoc sp. DedQUE02]